MGKANCWEIMQCGRGPGGEKVNELGECVAAAAVKLHGVHGGVNGGRACWVLAGTLCGGQPQGTFASKVLNCMKCQVYIRVSEEEGNNLKGPKAIIELQTK